MPTHKKHHTRWQVHVQATYKKMKKKCPKTTLKTALKKASPTYRHKRKKN